jgi:hypothetical protein
VSASETRMLMNTAGRRDMKIAAMIAARHDVSCVVGEVLS